MNGELAITPTGPRPAVRNVNQEVGDLLRAGLILDRQQTRAFLRSLACVEGHCSGLVALRAQLEQMLARGDWARISVSASSAAALRQFGASIGVIERKMVVAKQRLSPLQKWQRKNQLGRKQW